MSRAIFAIGLWLSSGASAAAEELRHLLFDASWAGLPAGQIAFSWRDDQSTFAAEMRIVTVGLPRWFTKFKGTATVEGIVTDGHLAPREYEAVYDLRKRRGKRNSILFSGPPGDRIAYRGPLDTSDKEQLEERYRRNVVDPLTTLLAIVRAIRIDHLTVGTSFKLPVFDSSRRFDAEGAIVERRRIEVLGGVNALKIDMTLRPIAGFHTPKDTDEDPEDKSRPVTLYVSDDGRATPLRAEIPIVFFSAIVELVTDCGGQPCALSK